MPEPEDLLQERLERLEAGIGLEACLEGVSSEVSGLLRIAAGLRAIECPVRDPDKVAALRSKILASSLPDRASFREEKKMNPETENKFNHVTKNYRLPVLISFSLVIGACLIIFILAGGLWLFKRGGSGMVQFTDKPSANVQGQVSRKPVEAVWQVLHGQVQILEKDNLWVDADLKKPLTAGLHIRTGKLSSAWLTLYDGSRVYLGPESELVIDELQADTKGGPRRVAFTQVVGTSEHDVATSTDPLSHYEVRTAAATGEAKGTQFKVVVNPDQSTWFGVTEGEVAVTGQEVTVVVGTGEATTATPDTPPDEPVFMISGQGEVALMGETWVIAGQSFTTHAGTLVVGSPQVGDLVFFEGRLLPEDQRVLDLVILLRRSPANQFSLTGIVEVIGAESWTVNGQEIIVTDVTQKDADIVVDDLVQVEGLILPDGTLQALKIIRLTNQPGTPFEFTGVVQETGEQVWKISGREVTLDDKTVFDASLVKDDLAHVTGWILEDGTWLAKEIQRAVDEERAFEFTGKIETMNPWKVAGVSFETREWTLIDEGLKGGDLVRVTGQVMEDGTWVAYEIHRLEEPTALRIVLVGVVFNMNPWVVSGISLNVDSETVIDPSITLGMLVRVEIQPLPDGTWKVLRIDPVQGFSWGLGCQTLTVTVVSLSGNQLQLLGWPVLVLGENVEIDGEVKAGSIVLIQVCFNEDGTVQVVYIFLLFQPEVEEPPTTELPGEKVMVCHKPHSKNPHTIVISKSAVPAHLGHGDTLGTCGP